MAWATFGTTITPNNQWQFIGPVEGEFFRLKHTRPPRDPKAWICQAEKLEDNSYQIFDIQQIHANNSTECFQLKKPAIFTNRCIGFRYAVDYKLPWTISLEVSDIFTDTVTTPNTPETTKALTYASDGDTNGMCYWLGTNKGTTEWSNPNNKLLILSASSIGVGTLDSLVDRADSQFYTNSDEPIAWIEINFQSNKINPTHYSIKTRNQSSGHYPRTWKLQGRKSDAMLIDLDVQANNTTLNANNQWLTLPVSSNDYYQKLRIELSLNSSGFRYLVLGEIEFYGKCL